MSRIKRRMAADEETPLFGVRVSPPTAGSRTLTLNIERIRMWGLIGGGKFEDLTIPFLICVLFDRFVLIII